MTEIRFYHLQDQTQEKALVKLLSVAVDRGHRIVVKMRNDQDVQKMNEYLWTYSAQSFLAHGTKKEGHAPMQPIWLTSADENPNQADILFLCNGVQSSMQGDFALCCELLDGQNDNEVKAARSRWKSYKSQDFEVNYWQQDERGRWLKKS